MTTPDGSAEICQCDCGGCERVLWNENILTRGDEERASQITNGSNKWATQMSPWRRHKSHGFFSSCYLFFFCLLRIFALFVWHIFGIGFASSRQHHKLVVISSSNCVHIIHKVVLLNVLMRCNKVLLISPLFAISLYTSTSPASRQHEDIFFFYIPIFWK